MPCGLQAGRVRRAAAARESSSGACRYFRAAKDHAVTLRCGAVACVSRCMDYDEINARHGGSSMQIRAIDQGELLRCCEEPSRRSLREEEDIESQAGTLFNKQGAKDHGGIASLRGTKAVSFGIAAAAIGLPTRLVRNANRRQCP